jgi:hypothetical protein
VNLEQLMSELEALGSEQTRRTLARHGAPDNMFGVRVGDMKKIVKRIGVDQALAEELYATGNADAQYLAGLIAEPAEFSMELLDAWALGSSWSMVSESMVAAIAAESAHGWEAGLKWIDSGDHRIASTGWAALNHWISITDDADLDMQALVGLLERIPQTIGSAGNRTRSCMNNFVIGAGSFVAPLTDKALEVAARLGRVEVDVGDTACKIPLATEYIEKVVGMGRQGRKRTHARC